MPKIASISLKNRKNRPALGSLPPDPLCLRRLAATPPNPHICLVPIRILRCHVILINIWYYN